MKKKSAAKKSKTKTAKSSKKSAPARKGKKTPAKKNAGRRANAEGDILPMIMEHHKPLKQLIKVLKDGDKNSLAERKAAFEEFAPLLVSHAKAEEQVLYVYMKKNDELREEGFGGDVEHGLADQMLEEIKRTSDNDLWSARVKVVAELVEHHIKEEEEDMFPDIRKETESEERVEMGRVYLQKWEALLNAGGDDSPSEKSKPEPVESPLTHS